MKIAFTSCSNAHQQMGNQPIWGIIHGQKPDLLLLLGDNVYLGNDGVFDKDILNCKYLKQVNEPHFNTLISQVPFLAIWDNHDFGIDADTWGVDILEPQRTDARELFNSHLKSRSLEPDTEFVYCKHIIGPVKLIMLDVRSYQESPGDDKTTLGTDQETWLLGELANSTSKFNIICSGITYSLSDKSWNKYTNWNKRFLKALAKVSNPLFLGGNMHSNGFASHTAFNFSLFPFSFKTTRMFEVISSSVGRNGDDGLPDNKYGLIDINEKTGVVDIALYSQRPKNNIHKVIKISNWRMQQ